MGIFNYDGPLVGFLERVGDIVFLNLIFLICCIPVFTIGAAITALSAITQKMVRKEEGYIIRGFFKAFKENFRQATLIWLIILFAGIILLTDFYVLSRQGGSALFLAVLCLVFVAGIIALFEFVFVFPLLARFDNTIRNTMKNALLLSVRYLPWTVLLTVIMLAPFIVGCLYLHIGIPFYMFGGFSLISLLSSRIFRRLFDPLEQNTETNG